MRGLRNIAALAAASLGFAGFARENHHLGRTRYPAGYKPRRGYWFKGDKGEQAAARRLRQAARDQARQEERAKASYGEAWQPGDRLSRRYRLVRG